MVGVDEVGRGCLAGPLLVVAARATAKLPDGLKDSKLMSRRQREEVLNKLSICCQFGEGWVEPLEIDEHGLADGLRLGVARALAALKAEAIEEIILDGPINYAPPSYVRVNCLIKADVSVPLVSAASIYAKVTRDKFMRDLEKMHPIYGFERHVGYATLEHRQALQDYGPLKKVHRMSFSPLKSLLV